jgi:tRNA(fMet)-specific endonuclease VapC
MHYMLDTNIVSDMVRRPDGPAQKQFGRVGQHDIGISIIVAAELRLGADLHYAEIHARLESLGTPIGANDLLIAAHALALGCILVTDNEREFARLPSLAIENWLR